MADIKARLINTGNKCFISDCMAKDGYDFHYHCSQLKNLYFDGKLPQPSFKAQWLVIDNFPKNIQRKVTGHIINERWEILDEKMVSEKFPAIIRCPVPGEYLDCDSDFKYSNLYEFKYDREPDYFEDVDIEWDLVMDVDDFEMPPQISFSGIRKLNYSDSQYTVTNNDVKHQTLDKIIFPEVLLHNCPCSFSSKTVYDITRQHVLEYIDNRVAKITSNYDFCFEVCKVVPLRKPEVITYQNIFARTKRERQKVRTSIKKYNEHKIFEMTHDQSKYRDYTPIPAMFANSEKELEVKMNQWLEYLMGEINKPLCECAVCNGNGFLLDENEIQANYTEDN